MNIKIRKDMAQAIGLKVLEQFGASETGWSHQEQRNIDLALLSVKQVKALEKLIEQHKTLKGGFVALYDLRIWLKSQTNPDQWARNARQMATLMMATLRQTPGQRLFRLENDVWLCYYVNDVEFVEKHFSHRSDRVVPAHVNLNLIYEQYGTRHQWEVTFWEEECRKKTPTKILAERQLFLESDDQRKVYLEDKARYMDLWPRVGLQLRTWGQGVDDPDGNGKGDSWYRSRDNLYPLGTPDEPGRAVIDIFEEEPSEEHRERDIVFVKTGFWKKKSVVTKEDDDDEGYVAGEEDELPDDVPVIEIPVHPWVVVFDLKRHLRLRVHVRNVEPHVYDKGIADKLVLPRELKDLVTLLIEHQEGGFQDIVKGKSGGAVVLLAGPPGTGKTLTAEVYAEYEERALYSVQCSQLGTDPSELEDELLKCFTRCRRWNAVMLLDEADVYVHTRGQSLQQNAIVGVFLRVLEYQSAVLFMTTNRPDDVDDAILSRCIARLSYGIPSKPDQKRIWEILADGSSIPLHNTEVDKIVTANPKLSGRDVKNLLKLAKLTAKGKPITAKMVEFVKQFKPTGDVT